MLRLARLLASTASRAPRLPLVGVGCIALLVAGCGAGTGQIDGRVKQFAKAVSDGDGRAACALLTPQSRDQFLAFSEHMARYFESQDPSQDCVAFMSSTAERWDNEPGSPQPAVASITRHGDRADIRLTGEIDGIGDRFAARRVDGDWKLELGGRRGLAQIDRNLAPSARCLSSWNAAIDDGAVTLPFDGTADDVWAQLVGRESERSCSMLITTADRELIYQDLGAGWTLQSVVARSQVAGMRNVWLDTDGVATKASDAPPMPPPSEPAAVQPDESAAGADAAPSTDGTALGDGRVLVQQGGTDAWDGQPEELCFSANCDLAGEGLAWSGWGGPTATGTGTIYERDQGREVTVDGSITLDGLRRCDGRSYYTHAVVHHDAPLPFDADEQRPSTPCDDAP